MAGTLNYFNDMNKTMSWIIGIIVFIFICYVGYKENEHRYIGYNTSSPVEEMYRRVLITTIDSILDARFDSNCCEEVIDSDDISVTHDSLGRVIMPVN